MAVNGTPTDTAVNFEYAPFLRRDNFDRWFWTLRRSTGRQWKRPTKGRSPALARSELFPSPRSWGEGRRTRWACGCGVGVSEGCYTPLLARGSICVPPSLRKAIGLALVQLPKKKRVKLNTPVFSMGSRPRCMRWRREVDVGALLTKNSKLLFLVFTTGVPRFLYPPPPPIVRRPPDKKRTVCSRRLRSAHRFCFCSLYV